MRVTLVKEYCGLSTMVNISNVYIIVYKKFKYFYSRNDSAGFRLPAITAGIKADNVDKTILPTNTAGKTHALKEAISLTLGLIALEPNSAIKLITIFPDTGSNPAIKPQATTAATVPIINDSVKNISETSCLLAPRLRNKPISYFLSKTEI